MKLSLLAIIVIVSTQSFAAENYCISVDPATVTSSNIKSLPDGSVLIDEPGFLYNGTEYSISAEKSEALRGTCKLFGNKKYVRHEVTANNLNSVEIAFDGSLRDTMGPAKAVIYSIQCK
jgi:hypothetical protein